MVPASQETARIGIDLGGTKIELIALDQSGNVLKQIRVPTPVGDYQETVNAITQLVFDTEDELELKANVGIGMPGAISPMTGKVKNSNSVCLNGRTFKQDLELALQRGVRIENDANCFVLSEATDGAAANKQIVFGVILGTGVGGGIVINGCLLSGPNAIAGEWGHNPLPWPDTVELQKAKQCYCGKQGCIETWLCGSGLSRSYHELMPASQSLSAHEVVSLAESGDLKARESLQLYFQRLAKSLASVINLIDPDIIVLGGGLSNIEEIYTAVPKLWDRYVFSDRVDTPLVRAKYGDASGVRGAAWL